MSGPRGVTPAAWAWHRRRLTLPRDAHLLRARLAVAHRDTPEGRLWGYVEDLGGCRGRGHDAAVAALVERLLAAWC